MSRCALGNLPQIPPPSKRAVERRGKGWGGEGGWEVIFWFAQVNLLLNFYFVWLSNSYAHSCLLI